MNLDDIVTKTEQIKAVAFSLESALIEADNGNETINRALNLFYVILEQIDTLSEELNKLNEHIYVCNAVFAVNRVRELRDEIEQLKAQKAE